MLRYWLPWPGKRKAILPGFAPLPRKMPCACSAFQACGIVEAGGLARLAEPVQQFVVVAKVDHQPFGRA